MEKHRIAIVRATNILPQNGVIKCISNTPNLDVKNCEYTLQCNILDILKEEGIIKKSMSFDEIDEMNKILSEYLPVMSDYNSVVLFSLNGLVPDDIEAGFANNTFSDKNIAIIDDLDYHLDNSNVISIVPTDTAIKGDVHLSPKAVILIRKERYERLTTEEKQGIGSNIKIFTGNLRQAVEEALTELGYKPERPVLGRSSQGFRDSETKEKILSRIKEITEERKIERQYHFDYALKVDLDKINLVDEYFLLLFYEHLNTYIGIEDWLYDELTNSPTSEYYTKLLVQEIKKYGIDNYKKLVIAFNKDLLNKLKNNELKTPDEIVNEMNQYYHYDDNYSR